MIEKLKVVHPQFMAQMNEEVERLKAENAALRAQIPPEGSVIVPSVVAQNDEFSVTIDELNRLVAETRQPIPTTCGLYEEWQVWLERGITVANPRHDYTGDHNAAMVLADELPELALYWPCESFPDFCVSWRPFENSSIRYEKHGATKNIAICLAWLAKNDVKVEVAG